MVGCGCVWFGMYVRQGMLLGECQWYEMCVGGVQVFVYVMFGVYVVEIVDYIVVDYVDYWFGYGLVDVFEGVYIFLYDYF